jgi:hypothetical protein
MMDPSKAITKENVRKRGDMQASKQKPNHHPSGHWSTVLIWTRRTGTARFRSLCSRIWPIGESAHPGPSLHHRSSSRRLADLEHQCAVLLSGCYQELAVPTERSLRCQRQKLKYVDRQMSASSFRLNASRRPQRRQHRPLGTARPEVCGNVISSGCQTVMVGTARPVINKELDHLNSSSF